MNDNINNYNPNAPGIIGNNIFGLPFNVDNAKVVIIPVPWDVTVSNVCGTSRGPENIKRQSYQIDLYDADYPDAWKNGIAMEEISETFLVTNDSLRKMSSEYISKLEDGISIDSDNNLKEMLCQVNSECSLMINEVEKNALGYLKNNKLVALIGGDHSTSLALIKAIARKNNSFGILQFDAHADLRNSYEGFEHSHASVMYNALKLDEVSKLVQVGIRDYCQEENDFINSNADRIKTFTAKDMYSQVFNGISWKSICDKIIKELPEKVYITFDADFLNPSECPTTGTPVPGGFSYEQALYLIENVAKSGKTIIGFDLVETGQGDIDGIVSCRILYRMILNMIFSNK